MKNLILVIISYLLLDADYAYTLESDVPGSTSDGYGGIDFTYSSPEIFFIKPEALKLSVIWEVLNCYYWDSGVPVNQCYNLEFFVVSASSAGERSFASILQGIQCLTDGCETIVELPLLALLTPREYEKYLLGLMIIKEVRMHLAFGGEDDQFGRIFGRKFAKAFYYLKYILNGTGLGSVAVLRMERQ